MIEVYNDSYFMRQAIIEAEKALALDEVPVGAVIICENKIIARAHNLTEKLTDVTAHAEMQAITAAANYLGSKYLKNCSIYISLEPCVMCAGAIAWAQIQKVVYAASDTKRGFSMLSNKVLHPKTVIESGILADEASELLSNFFKSKR